MKKILLKLFIVLHFMVIWLFFNISFATSSNTSQWNTVETQNKTQASNMEKNMAGQLSNAQNIGKWLYAVTWPLIIIAWKFMENNVIYGSFIGMDTLLWKIWNVMRTFANYIIWLILIFSIFTLFLWWKFEQFNPIKIIPQLVISSILVNASWFILWVCLDISSILTYSVGMLPLNVSSDTLDLDKKSVPVFSVKYQNSKNPLKVWVKNGDEILPFCEMTALTWESWVKLLPKNSENWKCVYEYQNAYYEVSNEIDIPYWKSLTWSDIWTKIETQNFWQLMKKHPWMSTVLWTLYASIIDIWKLSKSSSWTSIWMITDLLFKILFLIALIVPLFTFALIMIARAIVLWMFIIISPIIFLFTSIKWIWDKLLWEKWSLKEMCCMVFLPVTVTFALSISFVFLSVLNFTTLKTNFWIDWKGNEVYVQTDWNPDHKITIKFKDTGNDSASSALFWIFQNTILWIVKLMFAIWFMWVLVFTALKSCKIVWGIAGSIQSFAVNMAKATPVVPIAWWQSISSLQSWLGNLKAMPQWWQNKQMQNLENMFWEMTHSGKEKEATETITKRTASLSTDAVNTVQSWITQKVKISWNDKKIWDIKISDINSDPNKNKLIQDISSKFWLTTKQLEELVNDASLSWKTFWDTTVEWKIKQMVKNNLLHKLFQESLKSNITLIQLDKSWKQVIADILNKSWLLKNVTSISDSDFVANSKNLAQALKDFWVSDSDISKLIVDNLIWKSIKPEDKKKIDEIIKKLK